MKFGQCIMAAVIVQIQGIKDVSEIHKRNGVELSFFQHYNYRNIENQKQKYCLNQLCIMQFVKKTTTHLHLLNSHVLYLSDIHVRTPSWKHLLFLEHGL